MTTDQGDTARIWLMLVSKGGRWTNREIAKELPDLKAARLSETTRLMANAGSIVCYGEGRRHQYGVTLACTMPRCLTLADLIEAGIPAMLMASNDSRKAA